jgi:hypothetical protein
MYINPLPYVFDFMAGKELRQRIDCKIDLDSFSLFCCNLSAYWGKYAKKG